MKDFASLKFEVWINHTSDERNPPQEMVAIRAGREEGVEGLRYIWFVLTSTEFQNLLTGRQTTAEDGYHKVVVHGDSWFFYDMEGMSTNRNYGNITVPFYRANMPHTFMKAAYRLCKKTLKLLVKGYNEAMKVGTSKYDLPHRINIEVSQAHRDRSCRLYGQGRGNVVIDFGDYKPEETEARWEECKAKGDESGQSFNKKVEHLLCIARNQTWGFHQTARLLVMKDGEDFYWQAVAPNGRRVMNGGLINHGRREGKQDWATHT